MDRLIGRLPVDLPGDESARAMVEDARVVASPVALKDWTVGSVERTLWTLLGAVAIVLLVACANVANLFLVRAEGRHREIAVRRALGAGEHGIASYFLTEGLALGLAGGALGLGLAATGVRLLVAFGPPDLPRLHEVRVDGSVLAFAALLSVLAALLLGSIPLLRRRPKPRDALHGIGRSTSGAVGTRTRNLLMATQVALAFVLLVGSGLMARSFQGLAAVDPGFDPEDRLLYRVILPSRTYETREAAASFHEELVERIRALPGVLTASATTCPPLSGYCFGDPLHVHGRPRPEGVVPPITSFRRVADGYFEAAGVPLLRGRLFDAEDHARPTRVAVVDERLVALYFPGEDPIGRRVSTSDEDEEPYEVIGVVGHVVTFHPSSEDRPPQLYLPLLSHTSGNTPDVHAMRYVVRTSSDPLALVAAVRRETAEIDPNLALSGVTMLEAMLVDTRASMAFTMVLIAIAGSVALALGSIGIYGVVSYLVSQRTGEIGVRMAIGARPGDVAGMVLRQGGRVTALGLVAGLAVALPASRLLDALLFDVSATDPATYVTVALGLLVVSWVACWLPARRAARMDPVAALRSE